MKNKNIFFFVGTTAEYIKLAPIIRELNSRKIKFKLITSGQNRISFKDLEKFTYLSKAHINLNEKPIKSSMIMFLVWAIKTLIKGLVLFKEETKNFKKQNTYLFIHGDTVSSFIGCIIGKIIGIKIVHIESGLRSFNYLEPIPEEIIRSIIIRFADILFAPNEWALKNLSHVKGKKICTKQNTLIESCKWALRQNKDNKFIKRFGKYYILFVHRQEHIYFQKEWTRNIIDFVTQNANNDLTCVIIMHSLTSRFLQSERLNIDNQLAKRILFVPKLAYIDFMNLMNNAEFIATDGCTPQEEAYYMGLPYLALRNLTERTEGLNENVFISKGNTKNIARFMNSYTKYRRNPIKTQVRPSKIIVDYLEKI